MSYYDEPSPAEMLADQECDFSVDFVIAEQTRNARIILPLDFVERYYQQSGAAFGSGWLRFDLRRHLSFTESDLALDYSSFRQLAKAKAMAWLDGNRV